MSAAQEAAQALASGAPLLSRSSSMHASPPNAGPTPKSANVNASMRALAAMREPESESVAHKAFEAPASAPLTEEPEVVAAAEADDAPVERVETIPEADIVAARSAPPEASTTEATTTGDTSRDEDEGATEDTPLVEHDAVPPG